MPVDRQKMAQQWLRMRVRMLDLDEPMGGYPKSKAPELVVEPVVAMPNGGPLYGPAPPIFLDAGAGEPVELPTLSPDARLVVVGGTGTEPPTSYNWSEGNFDYTAMPEAIEQVFDAVTAGTEFGTLIASNRGLPRKPQWPNGKPGWPKGKPRKPAE